MSRQFETEESASKYLEEYFKHNRQGKVKELKIDFVDCKFNITFQNGYYTLKIIYFIGNTSFGVTKKPVGTIFGIIELLKDYHDNYTLDMDSKDMIPKDKLQEKIKFRNAIYKLVGVDYENCYVCMEPYSIMTPCKHYICSECYYKSIGEDKTFKCGVCRKHYANIGSYKPCEIQESENYNLSEESIIDLDDISDGIISSIDSGESGSDASVEY